MISVKTAHNFMPTKGLLVYFTFMLYILHRNYFDVFIASKDLTIQNLFHVHKDNLPDKFKHISALF